MSATVPDRASAAEPASSFALPARPVVAVAGLAPRCGVTTVARALAAQLARADAAGAAAVCAASAPRHGWWRSGAAARLLRVLAPVTPAKVVATGSLCLIGSSERLAVTAVVMDCAPLVLEVPSGEPVAIAASLADRVVVVASPTVEPTLAAAVASSLAQSGVDAVCVFNRVREPEAWRGAPALLLPDSPLGAGLAARGFPVRGALVDGIGDLADRCGV